ncbi:Centromere protein V [Colletotrichum orbiculare MAFF 240422]|uniref:Centromere protein V n=1 Tax=Colletotrichum orbiculare (strain 104-T / ATCC 96160 / CBS 514.97 / LARS 414 / MAFF 240422) TaxID=1213857 RepID=N4V9K7_COLOR|nr:Centromere protein V [Colletotrichum orbiculare MAFF 240422]
MVTTRSMGEKQNEQDRGKAQDKGEQGDGLRKYRGNCHCGAFVYEVKVPTIDSVYQCDCSIWHRKGYLWLILDDGTKIDIVRGTSDTLTLYTFGPKKTGHKFCPKCATPVMGELGAEQALNVRAIQGIDLSTLERVPYDGASLGKPYVKPKHKGPLPAPIDGQKLYTGSCHCGAVTLALMSKPLDETFDGLTAECDCSSCQRNAYRWIYPSKEQVVLHASNPSNIGRYSFAHYIVDKTFCKICGVAMTNQCNDLTEEERQARGALSAEGLPDGFRAQHPVNLRVLHDVDFVTMKPPTMKNGADAILPRYNNP